MAAPHRAEDHQETDQSSRSESAITPGTSTQEVKRYVAKKDSGIAIAGLFERLEVSPSIAKEEKSESKALCEEAPKPSPSSPKVAEESTCPRRTLNSQVSTSNFLLNPTTPSTAQIDQVNQHQPSPSQSTVNKYPVRRYDPLPTNSEPRTSPPVFLPSSISSPSSDEDSGEEGRDYCN